MKRVFLIAEGAADIGRALEEMGAECCELTGKTFPDGELSLAYGGDIAGNDVVVVARIDDPNVDLMRTLLVAEDLRLRGAVRTTLAAPYIPYMRQDSRFTSEAVLSSHCVGKLLERSWDHVATFDPHLHRISGLDEIMSCDATRLSATNALAVWIEDNCANPLIVGPDEESRQWVSQVASEIGCPSMVLEKVRRGDRDVEITVPAFSASGEHEAVLVDDIISTGHTLCEARARLATAGIDVGIAAAVHAVFAPGAEETLADGGIHTIVTTNTIQHPTNAVDIGQVLAQALMHAG